MKVFQIFLILNALVICKITNAMSGSALSTTTGLHIVAVYEGKAVSPLATELNPGKVKVNVTGKGPMILALSAYSATQWVVTAAKEVTIMKVILNGYDDQLVSGVPSSLVEKFTYFKSNNSLGVFPYQNGSADANTLISKLQKMTSVKNTSFQGTYTGESFVVSNNKSNVPKIRCNVGAWDGPNKSCSGTILAFGNMANSDSPTDASANCAKTGISGSCCMFHLYGDGAWFLTNGTQQTNSIRCSDLSEDACMAAGQCVKAQ